MSYESVTIMSVLYVVARGVIGVTVSVIYPAFASSLVAAETLSHEIDKSAEISGENVTETGV